jgi:hypothetical protein
LDREQKRELIGPDLGNSFRMKTLLEYAHTNFPNHSVSTPIGDVDLTDHTVVARTVGSNDVMTVGNELLRTMPEARVAIARIRRTEPTVLPKGGEDKDGVIDLPKRRFATSGFLAAAVIGIAVGAVVWLATSFLPALIVGVFAAAMAAWVGSMFGGAGRFAGNRAWEQPNAPDEDVTLLAILAADEADAVRAAEVIERTGIYDVRIVDADGAWHNPNG